MKDRQTRQKYLKENYNFICACNYCKDGKEDIEAFEVFEKFNQDAIRFHERIDEICAKRQNPIEAILFMKKEICCYKDMYDLGKKQKAPVFFLYNGMYLP